MNPFARFACWFDEPVGEAFFHASIKKKRNYRLMERETRNLLPEHESLLQKRQELHGHRRELHEKLTVVCEEFILEKLSRNYKRNTLIRELDYLLCYYRDEENWQGVD